MAVIYANLIEKGLRTIDQVPTKWRDATQAELDHRAAEKAGE